MHHVTHITLTYYPQIEPTMVISQNKMILPLYKCCFQFGGNLGTEYNNESNEDSKETVTYTPRID